MIRYVRSNLIGIVYILIISAVGLLSIYEYRDAMISWASHLSTYVMSIITLINLAFALIFWRALNELFTRYNNNYTVQGARFVYIDYISLFVIFSFWIFPYLALSYSLNDIVVMFFIGNIFITLTLLLRATYNENKVLCHSCKTHKYLDQPITDMSEDSLSRNTFIDNLYQSIVNLPDNSSFVYGLHGAWGEGKTSVINILKCKLDDSGYFVADYNPWCYSNEEAMQRAFFATIESTLSKKYIFNYDIINAFNKYQKLICSGISNSGIKLEYKTENSIDELKQKIESSIVKTSKRMILFIDDIDRLQCSDLIQLLKVVRLNANMKNLIFILGYDVDVINRKLKQDGGRDFIEKIIQVPIALPKVEPRRINEFVFSFDNANNLSAIDELLDDLLKREVITEEDISKYRVHIKNFLVINPGLFSTLRQAKRFIFSIKATLPAVVSEVNIYDFTLLEIIKLYRSDVYDDIFNRWWFYVLFPQENDCPRNPHASLHNEPRNEEIKNHMDSLLPRSANKIDMLVFDIIKELFPMVSNAYDNSSFHVTKSHRAEKKICSTSFMKYFIFSPLSTEMSDAYISSILTAWSYSSLNEISKDIEAIIKAGKASELFEKITYVSRRPEEILASKIINAVISNTHVLSHTNDWTKSDVIYWKMPEYEAAIELVSYLINIAVDEKKIYSTLQRNLFRTNDMFFVIYFVNWLSHNEHDSTIENYGDIHRLKDIALKRVYKYFIKNKKNVFHTNTMNESIYILYQCGSGMGSYDPECRDTTTDYILKITDAKIFSDFVYGLRNSSSSKVIFNYSTISTAFNMAELLNQASRFLNTKALSFNDRDVLNQFVSDYNESLAQEQ